MLSAGDLLGSYEIVGLLGEGGVGVVYRVRHTILGVERALKVMRAERLGSAGIRDRFLAEARIQAQLRHPNIVTVSDIVTGPGLAGFVMDLVEGRSLAQEIHALTRPPPPDQVRRIFLPILDAVSFAHACGVVHRDIKPENILLGRDFRGEIQPRITDFGIAKLAGDLAGAGPAKHATMADRALGTHGYMSPEQIRSARDVDHRTDIFALGITILEYATLRNPFLRDSDFDTMRAIVEGLFEIPESLANRDPGLARALAKALATRREDRFGSCTEFANALRETPWDPPPVARTNVTPPPDRSARAARILPAEPPWLAEAWAAAARLAERLRPHATRLVVAVWRGALAAARRTTQSAVSARARARTLNETIQRGRDRWAPRLAHASRAVRVELARQAHDFASGARALVRLPHEHFSTFRAERQRAKRAREERVVNLRTEASAARTRGDLARAREALQEAIPVANRSERRQIVRELRAVRRAAVLFEKTAKRREKAAKEAAERAAAAAAREQANRDRQARAREWASRKTREAKSPPTPQPAPRRSPSTRGAPVPSRTSSTRRRAVVAIAAVASLALLTSLAALSRAGGAAPWTWSRISSLFVRSTPVPSAAPSPASATAAPAVPPAPTVAASSVQPPTVLDPMVSVPAGWFEIGCSASATPSCPSDASPPKQVSVPAFRIDEAEVTVEAYARCVAAGGCVPPTAGPDCNWGRASSTKHPMNCVAWAEAVTYCTWQGKRLPTEAEWEKATRGEDRRVYPWGNDPERAAGPRANLSDGPVRSTAPSTSAASRSDGFGQTAPVGSFPSGRGPYGAVDLVGNVWEWVADWYQPDAYAHATWYAPSGPPSGTLRVIRGGSWGTGPASAQAWVRNRAGPTLRSPSLGFRCAADNQ